MDSPPTAPHSMHGPQRAAREGPNPPRDRASSQDFGYLVDPVLAHLESRGVPILEGPYPFGETRAVLIEDLDGMALELIEAGS